MNNGHHFIEIRGIAKEYRIRENVIPAIRQMDFSIGDGEFICIMGPSGSGKSTLLSVMGGLNRPSRGSILVDTLDVYGLSSEQRADFRSEYIGFIFQSFQLIPYLTVMENVTLPLAITGTPSRRQKDMAAEILAAVGLGDKKERLPDELSGGEQERVAIARAMVNRPPILLADEPTGNLDTATATEIMDLLKRLNKEGHTVIVVTHNPDMSRYAARVLHVRDGICVHEAERQHTK